MMAGLADRPIVFLDVDGTLIAAASGTPRLPSRHTDKTSNCSDTTTRPPSESARTSMEGGGGPVRRNHWQAPTYRRRSPAPARCLGVEAVTDADRASRPNLRR